MDVLRDRDRNPTQGNTAAKVYGSGMAKAGR